MGRRAWWWGLISVITGAVGVLVVGGVLAFRDVIVAQGVPGHYITVFVLALAPLLATHLLIAFNYMGAGNSLKAVVTTRGNDIEHLMRSLHKLGTAFMVEFIVGAIAMVLGFSAGLYFHDVDLEGESSGSLDFDFND